MNSSDTEFPGINVSNFCIYFEDTSFSMNDNKYLIGYDPINPINTSGGSRMLVYQERENNEVKKQKLIDLI